jgi:hypothetical protein
LLVHACFTKFDCCVGYAAFIAGVVGVLVQCGGMVVEQAATLVSPQVTEWARTAPSRAEQRQLEVAAIIERKIDTASLPTFVPDAPALPLTVLAAQMDKAELGEVRTTTKRSRRARLHAVASARPDGRSAADVFGRSFGVQLVASR